MKIKEVMKKVITVERDSSVKEAASLMSKHRAGSLIVVNGGKPAGIITERDIISKIAAKDKSSSRTSVEEVMSDRLVTVDQDSLIDDAVYLMLKHKIKKLPVLNDEKALVGIITSTDILANSDEIGQFYFLD